MSSTRPADRRGRDLDSAEEIHHFVTRFYREIAQDERFHPYFETLARVDWHAHTLTLTDFWVAMLFGPEPTDADAVIERHRWLQDAAPFDRALFDRWLEILDTTLDEGWAGPVTERARRRGYGMAWAMSRRLLGVGGPTSPGRG